MAFCELFIVWRNFMKGIFILFITFSLKNKFNFKFMIILLMLEWSMTAKYAMKVHPEDIPMQHTYLCVALKISKIFQVTKLWLEFSTSYFVLTKIPVKSCSITNKTQFWCRFLNYLYSLLPEILTLEISINCLFYTDL